MKKEKKAVPTLEVTSVKGSLYRNGSVNQTLYFHIDKDEELTAADPDYAEYYDDMMNNEIHNAIINKFIVSQPLKVTNDRIPFIIFKSNIDTYNLEEFCKAIVQEFSFHTGKVHTAQYALFKTIFSEINKESVRFRFVPKGEKITRSEDFEEYRKQPITFEKDPVDQGIMIPFKDWKEERRRLSQEQSEEEQEEIVEW